MTLPLFNQLALDWDRECVRRSGRLVVRRWGAESAVLSGFSTLTEVVEFLRSSADREVVDRAFAELVGLARRDQLAARVVMEGLRYALVDLAVRFRFNLVMTPEETEAMVLATVFERIRTYPLDRRPRAIAANLVLDTRQAVSRAVRRRGIETVPLDSVTEEEATDLGSATGELLDVITRAVGRGQIDREGARLIVLTRLLDVPLDALAEERGILTHSLRRARLRAEHALAAAVA